MVQIPNIFSSNINHIPCRQDDCCIPTGISIIRILAEIFIVFNSQWVPISFTPNELLIVIPYSVKNMLIPDRKSLATCIRFSDANLWFFWREVMCLGKGSLIRTNVKKLDEEVWNMDRFKVWSYWRLGYKFEEIGYYRGHWQGKIFGMKY